MQIHVNNFSISVSYIICFVIAILFIIISLFLLVRGQNNNSNEDNKGLLSWVEKKDLVYWLLIICLGAISTITYQYSGNRNALDHWTFAGTIVSIILAVVAIGFTLFQTLSSNLSSEKITVAADKIENASNTLDSSDLREAGTVISKVSSEFLSYHDKLQEQFKKIEEEIKSVRSDQVEQFNRFNENFTEEKSNNNDNEDAVTETVFIEKIYLKLPVFPQFFVYSLSRFQEEEITFTIQTQTKFVKGLIEATNTKSRGVTESMVDYALGNFVSIRVWINRLFSVSKMSKTWLPDNVVMSIKEQGEDILRINQVAKDYLEEFIKSEKRND